MSKVPKQKPDKVKKLKEDRVKKQVAIEKDKQMKIIQNKKVEQEKAVILADAKEKQVLKLEQVAVKTGKYRYSCDGCTKIAFWASSPQDGNTRVCPHCNKTLVTSKARFILD